jgi:hypothetical protein
MKKDVIKNFAQMFWLCFGWISFVFVCVVISFILHEKHPYPIFVSKRNPENIVNFYRIFFSLNVIAIFYILFLFSRNNVIKRILSKQTDFKSALNTAKYTGFALVFFSSFIALNGILLFESGGGRSESIGFIIGGFVISIVAILVCFRWKKWFLSLLNEKGDLVLPWKSTSSQP